MNMESARLVFLVIFCVSLYMLGEKWVEQYRPKDTRPAPTEQAGAGIPAPMGTPPKDAPAASSPPVASAQGSEKAPVVAGAPITVETDVLRVQISPVGGDIRRVEILKHRDTQDPEKTFVLLGTSDEHTYVGQSGLLGDHLPTHKDLFTSKTKELRLAEGANEAILELEAASPAGGVTSKKIYTFRRGEYVIRVAQHVSGYPGDKPPTAYYQLVRDDRPLPGESRWVPTFNGVAVFTDKDKYKKVDFSDIAKGKASHAKASTDGWIGMVQHYFVSAWLPQGPIAREFFTDTVGTGLFSAGVKVPMESAGTGQWKSELLLYSGPQEQDKMAKLAPGLEYTVDYGWLTIIAAPLFQALSAIHDWGVSNWGVAIIIVTVVIKLLFFPLSAASYKSMAKMRVLAPKLQKLKEQYGDDRQKLHQAMMEMYKTEKINPLGGCLPIVVQIPVFISLYWVLLGSVELRNAPFILWIKDLSSPDPFYILPVLMGISMIVQSRLNPEPPDPIQAKVMKIMPVAFSVFFFFFPAGLVLYWLVNNILSIAQQWFITRQLENAGLAQGKR